MNTEILHALMRLFALAANVDETGNIGNSRKIVQEYLNLQLNKRFQEEYISLFDQYISDFHDSNSSDEETKKRQALNSVKVLKICRQINQNLQQDQKIVVLIQLMEFIRMGNMLSQTELEFAETVAEAFNVEETEFLHIEQFVLNKIAEIDQQQLLYINSKKESPEKSKQIYKVHFNGEIVVLYVESSQMYLFKYFGKENIFLNGNNIPADRCLIFNKGSVLRTNSAPVYYSEITSKYLEQTIHQKIVFTAQNVEFRFPNSENGIHDFNFCQSSGELIGIMGGSGVGKSTLLNVLNGNLQPQSGSISINGIDINADKDRIKGLIGFVPQDDLLIEELTVFQNLYFNAKLCFDGMQEDELVKLVNKVLSDLDLYESRNLTVGTPLNKFISGGQRKRLNIALELIREPSVLFVDEPTSGLSSMDSEMVMVLLKEQAMKGKLVIINIHQPSSDIYKMFDKVLFMDKGGYMIFNGNPVESATYFKQESQYVNAEESECQLCGNLNPEQVLQIIESKVVDEYGKLTKTRKKSPEEWHNIFKNKSEFKAEPIQSAEISENNFKLPSKLSQFKIFLKRNLLSKLTNKQYLLINFTEAPLLAVILGYFSKYISGEAENPDKYIFSLNENIPAYLFMSVVCALFLGLIVSAEEIIRDRKILDREKFLNLSRNSYINSKVLQMFIISAIQTICFVVLGNFILEIKGMNLSYFAVLFSASCFANMLGLNLSAGLGSVVAIYILIPFILVPQLLLSGVIVKFDKLHKSLASYRYVSVAGDMMVSRWAYEALAVNQFTDNKYQEHFYNIEKEMSQSSFYCHFLIPELKNQLHYIYTYKDEGDKEKQVQKKLKILRDEIISVHDKTGIEFPLINKLNINSLSDSVYADINQWLFKAKTTFNKKYRKTYSIKDEIFRSLMDSLGKQELIAMKKQYFNESLANLMLNSNDMNRIAETPEGLVQYMDPVYRKPDSKIGRAHFYASEKIVGNYSIKTFWFNILVIWLFTLVLYIALLNNWLKRAIEFLERQRFPISLSKFGLRKIMR